MGGDRWSGRCAAVHPLSLRVGQITGAPALARGLRGGEADPRLELCQQAGRAQADGVEELLAVLGMQAPEVGQERPEHHPPYPLAVVAPVRGCMAGDPGKRSHPGPQPGMARFHARRVFFHRRHAREPCLGQHLGRPGAELGHIARRLGGQRADGLQPAPGRRRQLRGRTAGRDGLPELLQDVQHLDRRRTTLQDLAQRRRMGGARQPVEQARRQHLAGRCQGTQRKAGRNAEAMHHGSPRTGPRLRDPALDLVPPVTALRRPGLTASAASR